MKNNKKGFTLAELLVVVAIIAVLVAIAIPTFSAAKTKAAKGVAEANARSAYAEYVIDYMTGDSTTATAKTYTFTSGGYSTECVVTPDTNFATTNKATVASTVKEGSNTIVTDSYTFSGEASAS